MVHQIHGASKLIFRLLSSILILFMLLSFQTVKPVYAETIVNGNIDESTTWSGVYHVTYPISLKTGVRLVIMPGTVVRFDDFAGIDCYGQMLALGAQGNPVVFTPVSTGWRGLKFLADDPAYGPSELDHTVIEYAGSQGGSVMIDNANISITNSMLNFGSGDGVIGYSNGTATIRNTQISNKPGYAAYFGDSTIDPKLSGLVATGNGHNAVALVGGSSYNFGDRLWENPGIPYDILSVGFSVAVGETLTIDPGVTMRFAQSSSLEVAGRLIAAGSAAAPITFTSINPAPSYWQGLNLIGQKASPATAVISNAIIESGGFGPSGGNLRVVDARVMLSYSRIQNGPTYGVYVGAGGVAKIDHSQITNNTFGGIKNMRGDIKVSALNNWWGAANGPFHPLTNPAGAGNSVSDNVEYAPWLTAPAQAGPEATRPAELQVQVIGQSIFVPGSRQTYAIAYRNGSAATITNAVLVAYLPDTSGYVTNEGSGVYWAKRDQVFWRLGTLGPGAEGVVALTVEYLWGLPLTMNDSLLAILAGSNVPTNYFNVNDYLTYNPPAVTSRHTLTPGELSALLAGSSEAAGRYNTAIVSGYRWVDAISTQRSDGVSLTAIHLVRPIVPLTIQTIFVEAAGNVSVTTYNKEGYSQQASGAVMRYDHQHTGWYLDHSAATGLVTYPAAPTFLECMSNCIQKVVKSKVAEKALTLLSTAEKINTCLLAIEDPINNDEEVLNCGKDLINKIPVIGDALDIGTDLGKCNSDCKSDTNSNVCTADKYECNNKGGWAWFTGPEIIKYACDTTTGLYFAGTVSTKCIYFSRCVILEDGTPSCQDCSPFSKPAQNGLDELPVSPAGASASITKNSVNAASGVGMSCPACAAAQDPNAKLGAEGLVAPGQSIAYTVQYENVGAGEAYGVFVMDKLSTAFDDTSLVLGAKGKYLPSSRTIVWDVGTLAAKGQNGAKGEFTYSVNLRTGLAAGTVVLNQATVYFPSVPEVTPTNAVVNIVQPLTASDLRLKTLFMQPVSFKLRGFSANAGTLTYQISQQPVFGTLSGTLPNLTYTPGRGFTGIDYFYYTVSNGIETSQTAQGLIQVQTFKAFLPQVRH